MGSRWPRYQKYWSRGFLAYAIPGGHGRTGPGISRPFLGEQPKTSLLPPQALPETSGQSLASRAGTAKKNWRKKQTGFGKGPWTQSHRLREFTVSLLQLANAAGTESKVALLSEDAGT